MYIFWVVWTILGCAVQYKMKKDNGEKDLLLIVQD